MLCTIFYSLVELYQKTHSLAALTRFLILLDSWIKIVRAHFPWSNLYISTVHYIKSVVHYIISVVHYIISVVHHIISVVHHIISVVHYIISVVHYIISVVHYIISVVHYILLYTYRDLRAKKHRDKNSLFALEKPTDWSYDFFSLVKNDVSMLWLAISLFSLVNKTVSLARRSSGLTNSAFLRLLKPTFL